MDAGGTTRSFNVAPAGWRQITLQVSLGLTISLGCGGVAAKDETLAYDPADWRDERVVESHFAEDRLPLGISGGPLRAAEVDGEWSTFRGNPERSGTRLAPGIVEPTIVWSAEVGIQGYANTPLVTDSRVFVSSQGETHNEPDPRDGFYALDRESGAQLWFYPTNEDINGASLAPEHVIGGSDDGTLYAIDRESGQAAWQVQLEHALHHGPLVLDDRVFVHTGGGILVLDASDGQTLEHLRGERDGWAARGALAASGTAVYRTTAGCRVEKWSDERSVWTAYACEPSSEEWLVNDNYMPPMVVGSALVVLATSFYDFGDAALELSLRDTDAGTEIWGTGLEHNFEAIGVERQEAGYEQTYNTSLPWLMSGLLYAPQVTSSHLIAFDVLTGEAVLATTFSDCRNRQFPSIVGTPSRGYFARHDGAVYAFVPATGTLMWSLNLQEHAHALTQTAAAMGYGHYPGEVYCSSDPWDGSALFSTPSIGEDGTLYVGSGEGYLYAIGDRSW